MVRVSVFDFWDVRRAKVQEPKNNPGGRTWVGSWEIVPAVCSPLEGLILDP